MNLDGKTTEELMAMAQKIWDDPESQNPKGSLSLYTKKAQKKLDAIAWAVARNMAEKRAAEGNPVKSDGYSGLKQNRRR